MNYRRLKNPGMCYFFTINLQNRKSNLLVQHIYHLKNAIQRVKQQHPFEIIAIVVLPEHLHLLIQLPENDADYAMRVRLIKNYFSRQFDNQYRSNGKEKFIWQRRFWEHQIRDEDDFAQHVDYIHFNPVKHGYVERPVDWPHSSIHRYIRQGILTPDWAANFHAQVIDFGE